MPRRVRVYRTVLSMAMAQTQTEQTNSPIITTLTIQAACQNSVKRETSVDSERPDCATSAGFIGTSFPLSGLVGPTGAVNVRKTGARRDRKCRARAQPKIECLAKTLVPPPSDPRNPRE